MASNALMLFLLLVSASCGRIVDIYPPTTDQNASVDIFFGLIMSFGDSFNSSGVIPAVQFALDLINNDPYTLNGYTLHYVLSDSQCNHTIALEAFFKQILSKPSKLALIGGGCSVATEPVADIAHFYNISQLSCASSSSLLADRNRFRTYFQLLPTEIDLTPAVVSLCREYGWTHIVIIQQDENLFRITVENLKAFLSIQNISWTIRTFESSKGVKSLGSGLFSTNERIYFLAMYSPNAQITLCEAWKEGMVYPKYSFLTYGWYGDNWWIPTEQQQLSCTQTEMEMVLKHNLAITQYPDALDRNAPTKPFGITHSEFEVRYNELLRERGYTYLANGEQCFDGVMVLAMALNSTISELSDDLTVNKEAAEAEGYPDSNFKLENFTYKNHIVKELMLKYLAQTNYLGVTGPVSFNTNGIRVVSRLRVLQYRTVAEGGIGLMEVASVSSPENGSVLSTYQNVTVWPDETPYDGVPEQKIVSIHLSLTIIYAVLSLLGLIFACGCLIFNFAFRKQKIVKLSSSKLNYLIIAGAIIMYVSVILYVTPATSKIIETVICNVRPRVFSFGYSVCFGTILAKMWRVYYIFSNPGLKRKIIKDWHLILFVSVVVFIDIVLIGLLSLYKGGREIAVLIRKKEQPSSTTTGRLDYRTDYYTYICDSEERDIWLALVYGYKALLQLAALFLAFATRKVTLKGLNDSTYIAIIIYFTSVVITVMIIATVSLNEYLNVFSFLLSTCIFITSTVILALTFIPKIYSVYKDPKGESVFEDSVAKSSLSMKSTQAVASRSMSKVINDPFTSDQEKINALLKKITELESEKKSTTTET